MGKIIQFSDFRYSKAPKKNYESIQAAEVQKCMDDLFLQAGILNEIAIYAEEFLQNLDFHPALFSLSLNSVNDYMAMNFLDFLSGTEDIYMDFEAHFGGKEYTCEVTATYCEPEQIEFDGILFRKENAVSEVYDLNTGSWQSCPD